jgi:membrane protease YdiL (CAAX protease family)
VTARLVASLFALATTLACSRPIKPARTTPTEPPSEEELEAGELVRNASCSRHWGLLFPGVGQLCQGRTGRGAVIAGLMVAEVGTAVAVAESQNISSEELDDPRVAIPLAGVQDVWVDGLSDTAITTHLAARRLYAPRDSLTDLVAAPFNVQVMKSPKVWGPLLGALALGIGASLALSDADSERIGDDPNLFGKNFEPKVGYPLGFGVGAGLFTHVGIAEEALFRGWLQSSLSRQFGETTGWLTASLFFGLAHIPNAYALEPGERKEYLLIGIPIITGLGSYLGWIYKDDYSLSPPVALHFWYDLLLSTALVIVEPENNLFSARITLPF